MRKKNDIIFENEFLSNVIKQLSKNKYDKAISQELYSHILDRADYYKELGYSEEESMEMATEAMGNPEDVAVPLNSIYSRKWYKQTLNIVVIVLLIVQLIGLWFFSDALQYYPYSGDDPRISTDFEIIHVNCYNFHFIFKDFISLFIFCFNFAVIRIGWKKRSKPILLGEIISLFSQFYFYPYQPLFYGIMRICNKGFENYVDSIFGYGQILEDEGMLLCITGFFVTFMICCCVYPLIGIFRQERGTLKKQFWKRERIVNNTLAVFLAINIVLMSTGTALAYMNLENKWDEDNFLREAVLDCILDKDKTYEEVNSELEKLLKVEGAFFEGTTHFMTETMYVSTISFNYGYENSISRPDNYAVEYVLPVFRFGDASDLLMSNIYCDESEFDSIYEGMTFDEFLDTGLQKKAIVLRTNYIYDGYSMVVFKLKNSNPKVLHFLQNKYVDLNGDILGEIDKLLGE